MKDFCNKSNNTSKKLQEHGIYKHVQKIDKNETNSIYMVT